MENSVIVKDKFCPKCKTVKPVEEFHNNRAKPDGKSVHCKACHIEHYVGNTSEGVKAKPFRYLSVRLMVTVGHAKRRSEEQGIPFDISLAYIRSIFPEDYICPATGIKMEFGEESGRGTSPSIDRKIPELGYVPGNVHIISHSANSMKGDKTGEELYQYALKIRSTSYDETRLRFADWVIRNHQENA